MAFVNPNKPCGLSPKETLVGASWDSRGHLYFVGTGDTNAYYQGDLVDVAAGDTVTGLPGFVLATAGNPAVGVIAAMGTLANAGGGLGGGYFNPNNLSLVSIPATKLVSYYALVIDDPNVIFEIQESGSGTNLTGAAAGVLNANIVYGAPASSIIPFSGTTLNNVGTATTATLNLKILRFTQRVDNHFSTSPTTGGGSQKWDVLINNHRYRSGVLA